MRPSHGQPPSYVLLHVRLKVAICQVVKSCCWRRQSRCPPLWYVADDNYLPLPLLLLLLWLQVASPLAVSHLLQMLGSQQAGGSNSSSLAGAASYSSDGTAAALLPSDTLQLVLDVLQQRLPAGHASARGSYAGEGTRGSAAAAGGYVHGTASACSSGAGSSTPAASSSRLGAARQAEGALEGPSGEAAQGNSIKAHCWQLLTAVLQLAAQWHASRPGEADHAAFAKQNY